MIISASRRTDIPAFYSDWFIKRIRAKYCAVPNPFNRKQISCVSLCPEDVEIIVFWTRNPKPIFVYLKELDNRGYQYYFQFTVMNNPRVLDVKTPVLSSILKTFQALSDIIGPEKIIWRYDPIVFSDVTGVGFHIETYKQIAEVLKGYTHRSVISVLDIYSKTQKRLRDLRKQGVEVVNYEGRVSSHFDLLMNSIAAIAMDNEMEILSCAETIDLEPYGILPGKCIDDEYIEKVFNVEVSSKKDPSQRKECGCVQSKDIGMYDTCLFECQYCYATRSFKRAHINYDSHNVESPSLIGWYECDTEIQAYQMKLQTRANNENS